MSRRFMSGRISIALLIILLLSVLQLQAKNKKKQLLPEDVLRAQTIMVVIHPDAGEALTAPLANRNAQDEVERAITKWGRFDLVMDAYTADLIIAVRKGNKSGPIIAHSPADNRPVIFQPGIADARIGQQTGSSSGPVSASSWRHGKPRPAARCSGLVV